MTASSSASLLFVDSPLSWPLKGVIEPEQTVWGSWTQDSPETLDLPTQQPQQSWIHFLVPNIEQSIYINKWTMDQYGWFIWTLENRLLTMILQQSSNPFAVSQTWHCFLNNKNGAASLIPRGAAKGSLQHTMGLVTVRPHRKSWLHPMGIRTT